MNTQSMRIAVRAANVNVEFAKVRRKQQISTEEHAKPNQIFDATGLSVGNLKKTKQNSLKENF